MDNPYNVLSYQMDLDNESMKYPFPFTPRGTSMGSTLELEPLVPVQAFDAFKSTTGFPPRELMTLWSTPRLLCLLSAVLHQWQALQAALPTPAIWRACRSHALRMEGVRMSPPVPVIRDMSMWCQCQHSAEVSELSCGCHEVMMRSWWFMCVEKWDV